MVASFSAIKARRGGDDLDASPLTRRSNSIASGQLMLLLVYFTPVGIVSSMVGSIVAVAQTQGSSVPGIVYFYFIIMLLAVVASAWSGISLAEFDSRRNLSVGHLVVGVPIFTTMVLLVLSPGLGGDWVVGFFALFFLVTPIWIMAAVVAESINSAKFIDGSLSFGLDLVYAAVNLIAFLVIMGAAPDVIISSGIVLPTTDPTTIIIATGAVGVIGAAGLIFALSRRSTSLVAEYKTLSDASSPDESRLRHFSGVLVAAAEAVRHDKNQVFIGLLQSILMFLPFVFYANTIINDSSQSDLAIVFVLSSLIAAIIGQFVSATRYRSRADVGIGGGRGCCKLLTSIVIVSLFAALPIAIIALVANGGGNGSDPTAVVITLLILMAVCLFTSPEVASWSSSDRVGGCCGPAGADDSTCDLSPGLCGMPVQLRLHWGICVLSISFVMMISYFMVVYSTLASLLAGPLSRQNGSTVVLPAGFYILNCGTIIIFGISASIMNNVYNILGRDVAFTCGGGPSDAGGQQLKDPV
jgi:type III secretory pathway component EscS